MTHQYIEKSLARKKKSGDKNFFVKFIYYIPVFHKNFREISRNFCEIWGKKKFRTRLYLLRAKAEKFKGSEAVGLLGIKGWKNYFKNTCY